MGGEAYYLNAPFICQDAETAKSLMKTDSIRETINLGKRTDVALLGIGSGSDSGIGSGIGSGSDPGA